MSDGRVKKLNQGSGENRYKFQGFTERISNVKIDVRAQKSLPVDFEDDTSSHFVVCIEHWRARSSSESWQAFNQEVYPFVSSFSLVLHNKDVLVDALLQHLNVPDTMIRQALCELVAALAKDLRSEFCPFLERVVPTLVLLLDPDSPDELEWIFTCLCFLFKYLVKYLVEDIPSVYKNYYWQLLAHPRNYIRTFAAESLAYLMRKVRKKDRVNAWSAVLEPTPVVLLQESDTHKSINDRIGSEELMDGLGLLVFHTFKGIQHGFHSSMPIVLPKLLNMLHPDQFGKASADVVTFRFHVLTRGSRRLCNYTRRPMADPFWKCLLKFTQKLLQPWLSTDSSKSSARPHDKSSNKETCVVLSSSIHSLALARSVRFLIQWVEHRGGSRIPIQSRSLLRVASTLCTTTVLLDAAHGAFFVSSALRLYTSLCKLNDVFQGALYPLLPGVFQLDVSKCFVLGEVVTELYQGKHGLEHHHLLSLVLDYALRWHKQAPIQSLWLVLAALLSLKAEVQTDEELTQSSQREVPGKRKDYAKASTQLGTWLASSCEKICSKASSPALSREDCWFAWAALSVCSYLPTFTGSKIEFESLRNILPKFVDKLTNGISNPRALLSKSHGDIQDYSDIEVAHSSMPLSLDVVEVFKTLRSRCILTYLDLFPQKKPLKKRKNAPSVIGWTMLQSWLQKDVASKTALEPAIAFLKHVPPSFGLCQDNSVFKEMLTLLKPNLSASSSSIRRLTVQLLDCFQPLAFVSRTSARREDQKGANNQGDFYTPGSPCPLIAHLKVILFCEANLSDEKVTKLYIRKVVELVESKQLPPQYVDILPSFFLGIFQIPFSPIWSSTQQALAKVSFVYGDAVWGTLCTAINRTDELTRPIRSPTSVEQHQDIHERTPPTQKGLDGKTQVKERQHDPLKSAKKRETDPSTSWYLSRSFRNSSSLPQHSPVLAVPSSEEQILLLNSTAALLCCSHPVLALGRSMEQQTKGQEERCTKPIALFSNLIGCIRQKDSAPLANKHAHFFVKWWLKFLREQYEPVHPLASSGRRSPERPQATVDLEHPPLWEEGSNKRVFKKLELILAIFSDVLDNAKQWPENDDMLRTMLDLLSHPNPRIQRNSLNSLAKWKFAFVLPYLDRLKRLIDEQTFREELTLFSLSTSSGILVPNHAFPLAPILVRIIFPKLLQRKTTKTKSTLSARRAAIMASFAGLPTKALAPLIWYLLYPWRNTFELTSEHLRLKTPFDSIEWVPSSSPWSRGSTSSPSLPWPPAWTFADARRMLERQKDEKEVDTNLQVGFVNLLAFMIKSMNQALRPHFPLILTVLLYQFTRAHSVLEKIRVDGLTAMAVEKAAILPKTIHPEGTTKSNTADHRKRMDGSTRNAPNWKHKKRIKELREVRQSCLLRFSELLDLNGEYLTQHLPQLTRVEKKKLSQSDSTVKSNEPFFTHFWLVVKSLVLRLPVEGTQHRGGLWKCLLAMVENDSLEMEVVGGELEWVVPPAIQVLGAPKVSASVSAAALDFLEAIYERQVANRKNIDAADREIEVHQLERKEENIKKGRKTMKQMNTRTVEDFSEDSDDAMEISEEQEEEDHLHIITKAKARKKILCQLNDRYNHFWKKHMPLVLESMHRLLEGRLQQGQGHTLNFPTRELRLLSQVSKYTSDPVLAQKFTNLLLPLLKKASVFKRSKGRRGPSQGEIQTIFNLLASLVPHLGESAESMASVLAHQYFVLRDERQSMTLQALHNLWAVLCSHVSVLNPISSILQGLRQVQSSRLGLPDYSARFESYKQLAAKDWDRRSPSPFTPFQLQPLVNCMLADIYSPELAVRSSASRTVVLILTHYSPEEGDKRPEGKKEIPELVRGTILPNVFRGLKSKEPATRREWISTLRHFVTLYPDLHQLAPLRPLLHENPDLDLLLLISNIQKHRQHKALRRIRILCEGGKIEMQVAVRVLIPLVTHMFHEVRLGKSATAVEATVVEEAIVTLGSLAQLLNWKRYFNLLVSVLKQINKNTDLSKILIRMLCSVLDNFKFPVSEVETPSEKKLLAAEFLRNKKEERHYVQAVKVLQQQTKKEDSKHDVEEAVTAEDRKDGDSDGLMTRDDNEDEDDDGEDDDEDEEGEIDQSKVDATKQNPSLKLAIQAREKVMHFLLPSLHSLLRDKSTTKGGELVRVPIALAIVRLLKKLPQNIFSIQFPRLVTALCTSLASREEITRKTSRRTLSDVLREAGPEHFTVIVETASMSLLRGYQKHVLGHTVETLLSAMVSMQAPCGLVDPSLSLILRILMEEVTGEVGKEKEVASIVRATPEARKKHFPTSFQNLGILIEFSSSIHSMILPLQESLANTESLSVAKAIDKALENIVTGLNQNKSLNEDISQLLSYLRPLLEGEQTTIKQSRSRAKKRGHPSTDVKMLTPGSVEEMEGKDKVKGEDASSQDVTLSVEDQIEKRSRMRPSLADTFEILPDPRTSTKAVKRPRPAALMAFGLQLLLHSFKKAKFDLQDSRTLGLLDPFIVLIRDCCLNLKEFLKTEKQKKAEKSKSTRFVVHSQRVIELALRCSCFLIRAPLPSRKTYVPSLARFVVKQLKTGLASKNLFVTAFRTIAVIMRHCDWFALDENQTKFLFSLIEEKTHETASHAIAFALLKALLKRRVMLPVVYDLMKRVSHLMVQSSSSPVRNLCGECMLQFLLDYPLGEKRLGQHLTFLINNLKYEYPSGRLSVLSFLELLCNKFPTELLDAHSNVIFMHLVMRLSKDDNVECRQRISDVITVLYESVSAGKKKSMVAIVSKWLPSPRHLSGKSKSSATESSSTSSSSTSSLQFDPLTENLPKTVLLRQTVAVQVVGILASSATEGFHQHCKSLMAGVLTCFHQQVEWQLSDTKAEERTCNEDFSSDPAAMQWNLLYQVLTALEKVEEALGKQVRHWLDSPPVWKKIVRCLLHPHAWCRATACRLAVRYLGWLELPRFVDADYPKHTFLGDQEGLFELGSQLCFQLDAVTMSKGEASSILQGLSFVSLAMHVSPHYKGHPDSSVKSAQVDQDDSDDSSGSELEAGPQVPSSTDTTDWNRGLNWLMTRLSYLTRFTAPGARVQANGSAASERELQTMKFSHVLVLECVFKWISFLCSELPAESMSPYLTQALSALIRVTDAKEQSPQLLSLAQKTMEGLQDLVGQELFLTAYSKVQSGLRNTREARRQKRKQLAVKLPHVHARKKQRKNQKLRQNKKRQIGRLRDRDSRKQMKSQRGTPQE